MEAPYCIDTNNSSVTITEVVNDTHNDEIKVTGKIDCQDNSLNPTQNVDESSIRDKQTKRKGSIENDSDIKRLCPSKDVTSDELMNENIPKNEIAVDERFIKNEIEALCLSILNFPKCWTSNKIATFIEEKCGPIHKLELLKNEMGIFNGAVQVKLENSHQALNRLKDSVIDGNKLLAKLITGNEVNSEGGSANTMLTSSDTSENMAGNLSVWESDPKGIYGLQPIFLKKLGITPPINCWVNVSNFRCDKYELRDVMEMAGNVVICNVVQRSKFAKIMYSHPLEAVQAVSSLNGQMLYGLPLKVSMTLAPSDVVILPKGLADIGPGFGIGQRPLRDVVKHYEKYVDGRQSSLNPTLFRHPYEQLVPERETDSEIIRSEQVNKAIEAIKKLSEDGVTLQELMEALRKFASKPDRDFRTLNVEYLADDNEEMVSIDGNNTPHSLIESDAIPSPTIHVVTTDESNPTNLQVSTDAIPNTSNKSGQVDSFGNNLNGTPNQQIPIAITSGRPTSGTSYPFPNLGMNQAPAKFALDPVSNLSQPLFRPHPMEAYNQPRLVPNTNYRPACPMNVAYPRNFVPSNNTSPVFNGAQWANNRPIMRSAQNIPEPDLTVVHLYNVSPTTTFSSLCEKMSQVGQVLSLQFAEPGHAVVRFSHPQQASKCIHVFNNQYIEGYRVMVKL